MLEETTTGIVMSDRESATLAGFEAIINETKAITGKIPRLLVIGKEQADYIRGICRFTTSILHHFIFNGIEAHEIDISSYLRAVTAEEWEVLEEEWRIARAHDRPYSIIERLLARCYLQARAEITE